MFACFVEQKDIHNIFFRKKSLLSLPELSCLNKFY